MLFAGLIASIEYGLNRVLRLDSTALARLAHLNGKVVSIEFSRPNLQLFILLSDEGLLLATQWDAKAECTLRAPSSRLLHMAMNYNKTAILQSHEVELEGDSSVLMDLVAILQDLDLDWEYELYRWIGPVSTQLIGVHLRSSIRWCQNGLASIKQNLSEYMIEESRALVGRREAQARFSELDESKIYLERLEARFKCLSHSLDTSDKV